MNHDTVLWTNSGLAKIFSTVTALHFLKIIEEFNVSDRRFIKAYTVKKSVYKSKH